MPRFIVELRTKSQDGNKELMPSLSAVDAETLPLAQREVERSLQNGVADEAVIYTAARVLRATRVVTATDINGRAVQDRAEPVVTADGG